MADLPYDAWFAYLARHIPPNSPRPLAELFSGPARLTHAALNAGYRCIAVDRHRAFLKCGVAADALHLPFGRETFAALAATNASLNYLPHAAALAQHLAECSRVLESGGVYVFDVCPPGRALNLTAHTYTALAGKVRFAHRYESPLLTTTVTISGNGVHEEIHEQYIFTDAEIRSTAAAAGFEVRTSAENYGLPVTGNNVPVVTWVLCKP